LEETIGRNPTNLDDETDPTNGSKVDDEGPQEEDPSQRKQGRNAGKPASKASTTLRRDRLRVKRGQSIDDGKMLSELSATYTEHNSSGGSSSSSATAPEAGHGIKIERNGSIQAAKTDAEENMSKARILRAIRRTRLQTRHSLRSKFQSRRLTTQTR
jgi:hypothetical protein